MTLFEDLEAVRAFAGEDYEHAVVAGDARRVLLRVDSNVMHYDVAVEI